LLPGVTVSVSPILTIPPSVAVTCELPAETPVAAPEPLIVAIAESEESQATLELIFFELPSL
jgi:hypothetical protein